MCVATFAVIAAAVNPANASSSDGYIFISSLIADPVGGHQTVSDENYTRLMRWLLQLSCVCVHISWFCVISYSFDEYPVDLSILRYVLLIISIVCAPLSIFVTCAAGCLVHVTAATTGLSATIMLMTAHAFGRRNILVQSRYTKVQKAVVIFSHLATCVAVVAFAAAFPRTFHGESFNGGGGGGGE